MLFNKDWEDWKENFPSKLPIYDKQKLSAYSFGQQIASRSTEELCFALELVELIKEAQGQELATHTYSHYYCLEQGQNEESFRQDLEMAVEKAETIGVELKIPGFSPKSVEGKLSENLRGTGD